MRVLHRIRADLFRQPQRRRSAYVHLAFGVVAVSLGIAGPWLATRFGEAYAVGRETVFMGLGFGFLGAAELLPTNRHRSAGVLRIASIGLFLAFGAAIATPFLGYGPEAQFMMAFWTGLLVVTVVTILVASSFWRAGRR